MDPFELLDELRILGQNGLQHADDPYDEARYERIVTLASRYYGETLGIPPPAVRRRLAADAGHVTPKVGVQAGTFDAEGRILLVRRTDDHTWCSPVAGSNRANRPQRRPCGRLVSTSCPSN